MKRFYGYIRKSGEQVGFPLAGTWHWWHKDEILSMFGDQNVDDQDFFREGNLVFFIDGCVQPNEQSGQTLQQEIISLYHRFGESFVDHVSGEFAIVVWDSERQTLCCFRDHFGTRPFFYREDSFGFMFSNDMRLLSSFAKTDEFSQEWMADLLAGTISKKHETPFRDIYRLPPAHFLTLGKSFQVSIKKYWDLDLTTELSDISGDEASGRFRYLLERAVRMRMPGTSPIGSELSGGLDSTVIASLVNGFCKAKKCDFHTFSHVMDDADLNNHFPFTDERDYISQVVNFCGMEHHHFIHPGTSTILDALEEGLNIQGAPTQQRFYEFSDLLYARAKNQGVEVLFSGFGGDEGVSSHGGGYMHELMFKGNGIEVWKELGRKNNHVLKRVYQWLMISTQVHFFGMYDKISRHTGSEYQRIHEKINQLPLQKHIIKQYDVHGRAQQNSRFPNDRLLKQRQYKRIMHPHVSQRMEYSAAAAREFGIEYRYPLWDKDLIQFYINLPTKLKRQNNTGRFIYRKSVKDLIPDSIRWRNDKTGATIPSVHRRLLNDSENIRQFLDKCDNKGIGTDIFDIKRMKVWLEMIPGRNKNQRNIYQGMFFNYLMFLKHLEWKHEGKI